ncbi:hypothetical protein N0O92_22680 [Alkalihalobacillus sp. MEB130]|uniref:DNA sulfur modification protein DndB n=1 Tax=Alkalihalobacillus sp. MEB130 TaxID=2976704 RepID=UPI0028E05BD3|nr:DNA sulfur modification protein DndB [Alkalihalobacillus sp. MEB130]MDT8862979.1 hypothetical protein [Alkalihalobacillus sp. MEB130]
MNNDVTSTLNGHSYTQFAKDILVTQIPFFYLDTLFEIDDLVQRKLDVRKRNEISEFILDTMQDGTFYFSPFIFSARGAIEAKGDKWTITPGNKLYIIDGQHRASGLRLAIQKMEMHKVQLETYSKNDVEIKKVDNIIHHLRNYQISIQIYLDIDQTAERQLFTDLNMERKDVHSGIVIKYDKRDAYSALVKQISSQLKVKYEIEETSSRLTNQNSALTSLATMRKCLIALYEGNVRYKEGQPYYRNINPLEVEATSLLFFTIWTEMFPREMNNRNKFVCGMTSVQVSLALTVFYLTKQQHLTHKEAIHSLTILKSHCSWKHADPLFAPYYDEQKKKLSRLSSSSAVSYLTETFLTIITEERGVIRANTQAN